jgi:Fe2+ transport system protein FeoA
LTTLADLPIGGSAKISALEGGAALQRRLLDLGFTAGETVYCLFAAPSGEPRAYLAAGAVIALRRESARSVFISQAGGDGRGF